MAFAPSTQPRYYQILVELRAKIEGGEIAPGERLPTERELMETYGVSRVTVRRTLEELNALGMTEHRGKRGHFVLACKEPEAERFTENNLFAQADAKGRRLSSTLLSSGLVAATEHIASFFGIEAGTQVLEATCLRTVDGTPFGIERLVLSADLIDKLDFDELRDRPLVEILADSCEVNVAYSTQSLSPQIPTRIEASALNANPRRPLLMVDSRAYDRAGKPIILSELLYNTDVMEYTVTWTKR